MADHPNIEPSELRDIKNDFVKRFMTPTSGINGVRITAGENTSVLLVTASSESDVDLHEYRGLPVVQEIGTPGTVAVADRFLASS